MIPIRLSATAVKDWKECPRRFQLKYIEGLAPAEQQEVLRIGKIWHEALDRAAKEGLEAALAWLVQHYGEKPPTWLTHEEQAVEHLTFHAALQVHDWLYQPLEVVASELFFELPLRNPRSRMFLPTPEVVRVGKIDKIVRAADGQLYVLDHKSTTQDIDAGSGYWDHLRLDTQISFYVLAARDMGHDVRGAYYDVWRRPSIHPKWLTQAETRELCEKRYYCGAKFDLDIGGDTCRKVTVDEWEVETKDQAKGWVMRESPAMFAARLMDDTMERHDRFFGRREVARTDKDLARFEVELYSAYQTMRFQERGGHWPSNEGSCTSPYRCPFAAPICWPGREDLSEVPGLVRITRGRKPLDTAETDSTLSEKEIA